MKCHGPPFASVPGSDANRVAGEHPVIRSDTGRASSSSPSDASTKHATAPLQIVISPTPSGRKWIARLDQRALCVSAWPFVKSARFLLDEGFTADTFVELWRPEHRRMGASELARRRYRWENYGGGNPKGCSATNNSEIPQSASIRPHCLPGPRGPRHRRKERRSQLRQHRR